MASKLSLYNGALLILGARKLTSLSQNVASRRRLDTVWDGDTGVLRCLEQGLWNFAMRTVSLSFSPSVDPEFGYTYAFDKPEDWVNTAQMSDDENFCGVLDFEDKGTYWYADPETIYAKIVSKDTAYGLDLSLWTPGFTEYAEHHFASKICKATTGSEQETLDLVGLTEKKLRLARSKDAMNEGPKTPPPGTWSRSRRGNSSSRERGKLNRLIG